MKKLISVFVLFLSSALCLLAQFGVSVDVGFGTYAMTELKDNNNLISERFIYYKDMELTQTSDFPATPNFSFNAFYDIKNKVRLEIGYSFMSTGSRLYYEDYSGFYKIDVITKCNSIGVSFSKILLQYIVESGLYVSPQILFSNTNLVRELSFNPKYFTHGNLTGKATNIGIETGIVLRKSLRKFEFRLKTGYCFDVNKEKFDNKEIEIRDLKNDWTGFRFSLGLGYKFQLPKLKNKV